MPKVLVNGVQLHYITTGRGRDVVMVHGLLGNLAVWHLHLVPKLREGYRLTTYDLRGHGYSDVPETGYSSERLAADLLGVLDALEIDTAHLIGHSIGADICLHFALEHPERVAKLVAIEPGVAALHQCRESNWQGWTYWVAKLEEAGIEVPPDRRTDLRYLVTRSLETPRFFGPLRGLPRRREALLRLVGDTSLLREAQEIGSLTLEALQRITAPVLLIYGDQSPLLDSYRALVAALPNCTSVLLQGGEHFTPLEQPDLLLDQIQAFLQDNNWPSVATTAIESVGSEP